MHVLQYLTVCLISYVDLNHVVIYNCIHFSPDRTIIDGFVFKLIAVVYHRGQTCTSGHYYAVVRDRPDDTWTLYDDLQVQF